jgi:mono/diheme cytochrome c family protein
MRKMMLGIALSLLVVFTGCSKKSTDNGDGTPDGEHLVQERCASCHGLDRVYDADKDEQGWEESVDPGVTIFIAATLHVAAVIYTRYF